MAALNAKLSAIEFPIECLSFKPVCEFICLKNIAIKYQITPQAINKIENKLKKKFYHYLKIKIVDNQLTAVK